jgi:hypothetical protein
MLRLPDGMRPLIKQAAADNNRSLNAEIVARLEQSIGRVGDQRIILDLPKALLDRIEAAARHGGDSPTDLIRWALMEAYPAPTPSPPTLGEISSRLEETLKDPPSYMSEADIANTRTYLAGLRLAIAADPAMAKMSFSVGIPMPIEGPDQ